MAAFIVSITYGSSSLRSIVFICLFFSVALTFPGDHAGITLNITGRIEWKDGPATSPKGAKIAVLEGDPTKEGLFVFRVRVPDGYRIPPHTHPKMERVTVIQGTFNIGMGETFDKQATQAMPVGS